MTGLGPRDAALAALDDRSFDVLVVGGGITGAGIALELVARGRSCALVEARDFASGTSSRSSKLIHGGLRYLARGELGIVRESLHERRRLLTLAPDIVRPMPYLFPLGSLTEELRVRAVVAMYERLAGDDGLPAHRRVPPREVARHFAGYGDRASRGAVLYYEAQADDFRLTLAVLRAAAERGAVVTNHVRCVSVDTGPGATLHDERSGRRLRVRARVVVAALGVWLGPAAAEWSWRSAEMRPAKGIHLVLDPPPFDLHATVVAQHPDRRYLSLMPWHGRVLAGTTDVLADDDQLARPVATEAEVAYVVDAIRASIPSWRPIVRAAWAGFRPLLGGTRTSTVDLSREDRILEPAPGVIAVAGGKLTTYAAIARRVRALVDSHLGATVDPGDVRLEEPLGRGDGPRLVEGVPYTAADLRLAVTDEMATSLEDAASFRLGLPFVAPDTAAARADDWASEIAPLLGWDATRAAREAGAFRAGLVAYRPREGDP